MTYPGKSTEAAEGSGGAERSAAHQQFAFNDDKRRAPISSPANKDRKHAHTCNVAMGMRTSAVAVLGALAVLASACGSPAGSTASAARTASMTSVLVRRHVGRHLIQPSYIVPTQKVRALSRVVRLAGIEPAAFRSGAERSVR